MTTVGYGDVTPKHTSGRIVGAFVMLEGIALLTIVIAAITSTFVARAQKERDVLEAADAEKAEERLEGRLDEIGMRLDRLETTLQKLTGA